MIRITLILLLAVCSTGSLFGGIADTTRAGVEVSVIPRVDQFYSPTRGFGPVVDVTIENLGWEGSHLFLSAATMTRHGEYRAFLFTREPHEADLYAAFGASYTGSRAYRFFGLGPRSHVDDELGFTTRRVEVEGRLGFSPFENVPVTLQPVARLRHAHMRSFEEIEEGAIDRLGSASVRSVERAIQNPSTGIELELGAILDLFDNPTYPLSGAMAQLVGRRYIGLDADPFHYWQGSAIGHAVVPIIGERLRVEGRLLLTVTRPTGNRPIPFYALPVVGTDLAGGFSRHRLVGRDVLAASAGLRFPVLTLFGFGADGFLAGHLVNTFDDVFTQFEPRVSFSKHLDRDSDRAPLRPALTIGGTIVDRDHGRAIIGGQIGISPEGFELATLNFVLDLRTRQPRVR